MDGTTGDIVGFIALILFFLISLALLLLYNRIRSWIRSREQESKNTSSFLRQTQNRINLFSKEIGIYSESDPEPYGRIVKQVNADLVLSSHEIQELNRLYGSNRTLLRKITKPEIEEITVLLNNWREFSRGKEQFDVGKSRLTKNLQVIEKNITRLSNITNDVGKTSKKILELISVSKSKLKELEEINVTDEAMEKVSQSLGEWEQTALNQIPVGLITGDPNDDEVENDRVFVAKIFRLLNSIEPEIRSIASQIAEWRVNYDRYQLLKSEITSIDQNTWEILEALKKDKALSVKWGPLEHQLKRISSQIQSTQGAITVSELNSLLEKFNQINEEQSKLLQQIQKLQQSHQELTDRLRKRQSIHQIEWAKNAIKIMGEAREYNLTNWPGIQVGELEEQLRSLLDSQTKIEPIEIPGTIEASRIDRYLTTLKENEANYQRTSSSFNLFFTGLQEIRKLDEEIKTSLNQFYTSLKQLGELVSSNPSLKKVTKDNIQKYIQKIEEINADVSDLSRGQVRQKSKRWIDVSQKIIGSINTLKQKLIDENALLMTKLREQVDTLQNFLAFNEPVFYGAMALLKEQEGKNAKNVPIVPADNLSILELIQKIRHENDIWQRLTASISALEEVSGPIIERLDKLEANREILSDLIEVAEAKVPETLSWPPTTKRITSERWKITALDEKYQQLRKNRTNALQLVAILSDLTDQYKELISGVRVIVREAESEQKKFEDLDNRLIKSIELWQKLARSHKSNLLLSDNVQELLTSINRDYVELKKRYQAGRVNYTQAYQMFRIICRRIDQESIEFDDKSIIDISGDIQHKL